LWQTFITAEGNILRKYIITCSRIHYGLPYKQLRKLVLGYTKNISSIHTTKQAKLGNGCVGFWKSFMKRHKKISLIQPENSSMHCCMSLNKRNILQIYKNDQIALTTLYALSHVPLNQKRFSAVVQPCSFMKKKQFSVNYWLFCWKLKMFKGETYCFEGAYSGASFTKLISKITDLVFKMGRGKLFRYACQILLFIVINFPFQLI
jgi:hypothetical protein